MHFEEFPLQRSCSEGNQLLHVSLYCSLLADNMSSISDNAAFLASSSATASCTSSSCERLQSQD